MYQATAEIQKKYLILNKIFLLSVCLAIFFVVSKTVSFYILLALCWAVLAFFLFKKQLYWLLVLALPTLTLGQIISLEIRPGWYYEMSLAEVFILTAAFVFILEKILDRQIGLIKVNRIIFLLILYLVISIASFGLVINLRYYLFGLKVIVFSFLSYFLAYNLLDDTKKIHCFLKSLVVTLVILTTEIFIKFYQMGFSSKFFFDRKNIILPMAPLATTVAILAVMLPVILTYYFTRQKSKNNFRSFVLLIIFLSGLLAVFLSLGKAAILSLILGSLYLFKELKNKRILFTLFAASFAMITIIVFTPFVAGLWQRLNNTLVDQNTQYRILEYKTSFKIISEHQWLGIGPGQQLAYFMKMLNYEKSDLINNFSIQALVDAGVLGLSVVLLIVFSLVATARKLKKAAANSLLVAGFIAAMITAFFNGLAEVTFFALPYAIVFWTIVGVFSNMKIYEKAISNNNQL